MNERDDLCREGAAVSARRGLLVRLRRAIHNNRSNGGATRWTWNELESYWTRSVRG
jgi:hypothetical protein